MQTISWVIPSVVGMIIGIICPLLLGRWVLSPPNDQVRRGYLNAVTAGILLAAAVKFIPTTLSEIEFVGYQLLNQYIFATLNPSPDSALALFTQPSQLQLMFRPFLAALIIILFFNGNGVKVAPQPDAPPNDQATPSNPTGWRARLALPPLEKQADQLGLFVVVAGLLCYTLWLGTGRTPLQTMSQPHLFLIIVLLIFSGAVLGVATLGLIPNLGRYWRWVAAASLLFGLATTLGVANLRGQIILSVAPLLLIFGTLFLVYGLGRLLRVLQYQIGTGWRTTLTVLISALLLYQGNQFLSYLM
jgi:hypothetical protein